MNDLPLGVEIYIIFFAFFPLIALPVLPVLLIYYFVNLYLNIRDPDKEHKLSIRPISKFEKLIRSSAGTGGEWGSPLYLFIFAIFTLFLRSGNLKIDT